VLKTSSRSSRWTRIAIVTAVLVAIGGAAGVATLQSRSPLPLPTSTTLEGFERQLYAFLDDKRYQDLGWKRDRGVRDTGPYIDGTYYGTHPAVRIFYSPEVYEWLVDGRPDGGIPDGAMIIKEMYPPPAARYAGMSDDELRATVSEWTVMVKDASGSKDGWFWSYYGSGQTPDSDAYPFNYPLSGFGQYCVRCHASTEPGKELTFASLRNIEGEEAAGDPLTFRVDDSWKADTDGPGADQHVSADDQPDAREAAAGKPLKGANPDFLALFDAIAPVSRDEVQEIPPVTLDHVVAAAGGAGQFITSDNCISCHDGQNTPLGHNMTLVPDGAGGDVVNLSPYGEWRWSMMGLAGRDPIFYAQLESEITLHPTRADEIQNLCFRCHGAMAQRRFHIDNGDGPDVSFTRDIPLGRWTPGSPEYRYAALARDGISCMVCHQIVDDGRPFAEIVTGQFEISTPGDGGSTVFGPFDDVVTLPMENALGITPRGSDYVSKSRLCGSCHSIYLPVYDRDGNQVDNDYEQSTYLEWLNSDFRTELGGGADPRNCQDCHMPGDYHGRDLEFRIANIQDDTYPAADNLAPVNDIALRERDEFRRHTLYGINLFGLEMFRQFDDILGVRTSDYMSGTTNDLDHAIAEGDRFAKQQTARVEISRTAVDGNALDATVKVTNLAGHRFPSGVGFRRAFVELLVTDAHNTVVWASGRTNSLGVIVDERGRPLPSEFPLDIDGGEGAGQAFQPHYDLIERQNQVQIYQELVRNTDGHFTTSFVSQADTVKDNRLLPKGWTPSGPPGFAPGAEHAGDKQWDFPAATMPKGGALADRAFLDGSGSDSLTYRVALPDHVLAQLASGATLGVTATLYYQAIPPSWLDERFRTAQGDSGKRLHYITSHLNLDGTPIDGWKLEVSSATRSVGR